MNGRQTLLSLLLLPCLACSDGDAVVVPPTEAGPDVGLDVTAVPETGADADPDGTTPGDSGAVDSGTDAGIDAGPTCIVVDAKNGNDANAGTALAPVKTLTYAIKLVSSPGCITLKPGLYDDKGNGETFPMNIPATVSVVGDEKGKGLSSGAEVRIAGTLPGNSPPVQGMIQPGASSTLAGVSIGFTGQAFRVPILLTAPAVTLRNDSIDHCTANAAVYVGTGGKDYVITGNDIFKNTGIGLAMIAGGAGSKVEGNSIVNNNYGVEVDVIPNADFGGGAQNSLGNNVFSCNAVQDFWTVQTNGVLAAKGNYWDHQPPQIGNGTGDDVNKSTNNGASVDTANAKLAVNPCP